MVEVGRSLWRLSIATHPTQSKVSYSRLLRMVYSVF